MRGFERVELRAVLDETGDSAAQRRLDLAAAVAEWSNMHDGHLPHPGGPPLPRQSCAKLLPGTEGTDHEVAYCGKLFPRALRKPGEEAIAEDPHRRNLYRIWLARNCHLMNNYHPLLILAILANMDIWP